MFPDPSSFESHAGTDDSNHNQTVSPKNSLVWGEALALPSLFPDKVHGCIEPRMPWTLGELFRHHFLWACENHGVRPFVFPFELVCEGCCMKVSCLKISHMMRQCHLCVRSGEQHLNAVIGEGQFTPKVLCLLWSQFLNLSDKGWVYA